MKTIELEEATDSLSAYAKRFRRQPLIVTLKGRPMAALTPIGPRTDLENLAVANDPRFRALIERSRRLYPGGSGIAAAEVRRSLASPAGPLRRRPTK
jgi:antitoxin (DNA-binding transcriptional repressor) of toxin-antitoxin stability system